MDDKVKRIPAGICAAAVEAKSVERKDYLRELTDAVWLPLLRETLTLEGRFRFPLRGNSMRPTLPTRCDIEVIPLSGPPRLGNLIVFVVDDVLVAHRFVRRSASTWIAQGDNRRGPDRPLLADQILGLVQAAYVDGLRVWPGTFARVMVWFWIVRHHGLRGARWIARKVR